MHHPADPDPKPHTRHHPHGAAAAETSGSSSSDGAARDKARSDEPLFLRLLDPDRFEPTSLTAGPWDPRLAHGGAVAGLLTRCLERAPAPVPMRLTRIGLEILRGVPVAPLRVELRMLRTGRRTQSLEAGLFAGATLVARATALRLRRDEGLAELASQPELPADLDTRPEQALSLATADRFEGGDRPVPGFVRSVELASLQKTVRDGVPVTVWARLLCRVVEGEDPSPTVRMATLVDFASGTGSRLDFARHTSINPDLTIHVLREARSEWIAIHGATWFACDGIGQSSAAIYDEQGRIAGVQASLLLERRG